MGRLKEFWAKVQGELLFDYFWLVSRTSNIDVIGQENLDQAMKIGRPLILAGWHQQVMLMAHFVHGRLDARKLMPVLVGDKRGLTLDHVGRRVGVPRTALVDMTGNPMSAGRSVLHVVRAMKKGFGTVIAPDGPDGPAFVAKPGMAFLAQKAEAIVLPIGAFSRPAKELNRWDRYLVTMPFSRMYFAIGQPIEASQNADPQCLTDRVSEAMHQTRLLARSMAGVG